MSQTIHQQSVFELTTNTEAYCEPDVHGHCITCSDEALQASVVEVDEMGWTAVVQIDNQITEVDISLVDDVVIGSVLLVHGGVALEKLASERVRQ